MKELRYYQLEAVKAAVDSLRKDEIPYLSLPTGSGKSLVLAELSKKALKQGRRVLQIVPRKELVIQNYVELGSYYPDANIGICCGGLYKAEYNRDVTIATIGSIVNKIHLIRNISLVLIDECHLVSTSEDTMYRKAISDILKYNPRARIIGVTATPYRARQGYIHNVPLSGSNLFTAMAYEANVARLIHEGYLSHVESISGEVEADLTGVTITNDDYNTSQMSVKFDAIIVDAVADMKVKFAAYNIQTAIIFSSSIENAQKIVNEFGVDEPIRIVHGKMPDKERKEAIAWLKDGTGNRYIVNVDILTTGFDYSKLNCVVFMRATKSLALYVQICGRVIRSHAEKEVGYILDYGTNIERHGPIDDTRPPIPKGGGTAPKKECKLCGTMNRISAKKCSECEAEFVSLNDDGDYSMRSKAEVLKAKLDEKKRTYDVSHMAYEIAFSKKDSTPMIEQRFLGEEYEALAKNYICLDHTGYANHKAKEILVSMFKELDYYAELCSMDGGINVDNTYALLTHHDSDKIFKKIVKVSVEPNEKNPKYMNVTSWEYADGDN